MGSNSPSNDRKMYESKLNQLLHDAGQLNAQCITLTRSVKNNGMEKKLEEVHAETKRFLDRLKGRDNLEGILTEFLKTVENGAETSIASSQNLFDKLEMQLRELKAKPRAILKQLEMVVFEIDRWFNSKEMNKGKLGLKSTHNRKGKDIKKVKQIKGVVGKFQSDSLSTIGHELKMFSENLSKYSKFKSVSTAKSIRLLRDTVSEIMESEASIDKEVKDIKKRLKNRTPKHEDGVDWFAKLNDHLHSRTLETPQNHRLNDADIVYILDGEFREVIDSVTESIVQLDLKNAMIQQQTSTIERMNFSMFDFQKRSISAHILKRLKRQKTLKEGGIKQLLESLNTLEEHIANRHEVLSADIPSVLNRHFKNDQFGKYVVHYSPLDEKSYVRCRKKQWNRYPNFFFCIDSITKSSLPKKQIDEIIKLPVSQELCKECLDGRLTIEQALILNSIDFSGELLQLFRKGVDLEFMFSLYDAKDSGWLVALLENPDKHAEIMQLRRHTFNSHLWTIFVKDKIELWQLLVLLNIGFTDEILSEMCEGEEPWKEAEDYYAPENDLEERLKNLRSVYGPKSNKDMTVLSLSDVCKSVGQVAEYSVNKPKKKKSKVVRRRRSSYRLD